MKSKRSISALLAVFVAFSLCGCQLAQKDAGGTTGNDRFIGVLITREYLDLFDTEGYLNDNLQNLSSGEMNMDGSGTQYQGRLYASLQKEIYTTNSGEQTAKYKYAFPGVDGMSFFTASCPESLEAENFMSHSYDDAICNTHLSIFEDERVEMSGTIYLSSTLENKIIFLNPVYQTGDGRVYVLSGNAGQDVSGITYDGSILSQTIDEKSVVTENGKSKTIENSTTVSIEIMNPPEKIAITQMDQNSEVVKNAEFVPGELPETLKPEASTEYIVLATYQTDSNGAQVVTRELFTSEDYALLSFYAGENGICLPQCTRLEW